MSAPRTRSNSFPPSRTPRPTIGLAIRDARLRAQWQTALAPLNAELIVISAELRRTHPIPLRLDLLVCNCPEPSESIPLDISIGLGPAAPPPTSQLIVCRPCLQLAIAPCTSGELLLPSEPSDDQLRTACELLLYLQFLRRELRDASQRVGELEELARRDPLTRLPNRRDWDEQFPARVAAARQAGAPLCLVLLDLQHFKRVNDRWGLAMGDRLLVAAAERLAQATANSEYLARLGGDEFALLLPLAGEAAIQQRVGEITRQMTRPLLASLVPSHPSAASAGEATGEGSASPTGAPPLVALGVSTGWSLLDVQTDSPESLFFRADAALRRTKEFREKS